MVLVAKKWMERMVKMETVVYRSTDSIVRYGGDEFLLLIPGIDEDTFVKKLREIRERVFAADVPGYSTIHLSVSVGGLFCSNEMLEKVVEKADRLMYQAKNQKNTVVMEKGIVDANGNTDLVKKEKVRQQILIVDDSEMNREILSDMLDNDFRILEQTSEE